MKREFEYSISVIICCYNPNYEKLKNTINSIYNQKEIDFEIIISDDGTKDNYVGKVKRYFDEIKFNNYQLNFLTSNQGTVKNILSAVKIAKGKYIKTISPGDYLYDSKSLKSYYDNLEINNADIVFSRGAYYQGESIMAYSAPSYLPIFRNKNLKRNIILFNDYVLGAAIAMKREIALEYFERISGFSRLVEDMPLIFLTLLDGKKIFAINDFLVWYEYGFGVSTGAFKELLISDYENCYKKLFEDYKNSKLVLKGYKFYKSQFDNFIKKHFKRLILSYDYVYHYLRQKFYLKKDYKKVNIDGMHSICKISMNKERT